MQPSLLCDLLAQQARLKTKRKREKKKYIEEALSGGCLRLLCVLLYICVRDYCVCMCVVLVRSRHLHTASLSVSLSLSLSRPHSLTHTHVRSAWVHCR